MKIKIVKNPKGRRALTKPEQQQRVRARLRIINEELGKIGLNPIAANVPPIYLHALRAYEEGFHTEQNMVKTVVFGSSWLCLAIENFIKQAAETMPDSPIAKIYHSAEWITRDSLDFNSVATNATTRIVEFEKEHEERINS